MKITVICVGKIKESFFRQAIDEYKKRLGRYAKLEIIELLDEKTPDRFAESLCNQIKSKEGERILSALKEDQYVIALEIQGRMIDSVELSDTIEKLGVHGTSQIAFIIGGSLGLDDRVIKRADYLLSFSKMTFPHQMMRVILLEQIYRAYRIMNHEPYHK